MFVNIHNKPHRNIVEYRIFSHYNAIKDPFLKSYFYLVNLLLNSYISYLVLLVLDYKWIIFKINSFDIISNQNIININYSII